MDDFIRPVKDPEPKQKKKRNFFLEIIIVVVIIVSLGIGFAAGYLAKGDNPLVGKKTNTNILDEAYLELEENWYNSTGKEIDLQHNAISGLVAGLKDQHSDYWTVQQAADFNESVDGNYVGIGIGYRMVKQGALVSKVYDNSPASEVGLKVGDIILTVNNESMEGKDSDEVKEVVRGKDGSKLSITYLQDSVEKKAELTRSALDTSVHYEVRESNGKKFGYIELTTFGSTTGKDVANALKSFKEQGVGTLVLDLRDNGGGYLNAAEEILNLFIDSGDVMYQVQSKSGPANKVKAKDGDKYQFASGYILVNSDTASASEILSGALQELCDYQLIGTKTYGKGTAQTQKELSDGSILKYTYARWLTPKGNWIHGKGLTPNVQVNNMDTSKITIRDFEDTFNYDQVSDVVASMQKMLTLCGYKMDREDGYFSKQTEEALNAFKKDQKVETDGIYDVYTQGLLMAQVIEVINDSENDLQYAKLLELIK